MAFSFRIDTRVRADPATVFAVLTDHRGYAAITPLRRSTLDREGDPAPDGVGAVRRFELAGPAIVEEVVRFEPPARFAYRALAGLPVSDHLAEVELEAADGGTRMRYRIRATPKVAHTDRIVEPLLRAAVVTLMRGIRTEAERRARAGTAGW